MQNSYFVIAMGPPPFLPGPIVRQSVAAVIARLACTALPSRLVHERLEVDTADRSATPGCGITRTA
jgi:hypothetical protein